MNTYEIAKEGFSKAEESNLHPDMQAISIDSGDVPEGIEIEVVKMSKGSYLNPGTYLFPDGTVLRMEW